MDDDNERILKDIERKRARNNVAHVGIIRIALEARPEETKALLLEISDNDAEITRRTRELAQ